MNKKLISSSFGDYLKRIRIDNGYSLREVCQKLDYDYSNWSKIERGVIPPPSDERTLKQWAAVLGIRSGASKEFIHLALIAQGIIPSQVIANKKAKELLPAFFRTMGNIKPSKEEIEKLIDLLRKS